MTGPDLSFVINSSLLLSNEQDLEKVEWQLKRITKSSEYETLLIRAQVQAHSDF